MPHPPAEDGSLGLCLMRLAPTPQPRSHAGTGWARRAETREARGGRRQGCDSGWTAAASDPESLEEIRRRSISSCGRSSFRGLMRTSSRRDRRRPADRAVQSLPIQHGETLGFLQWMQADSRGTTLNKRVHEVVIPAWARSGNRPTSCTRTGCGPSCRGSEVAIQALCRGESSELTP